MNSKFANVTKNQIETLILPFVPVTNVDLHPELMELALPFLDSWYTTAAKCVGNN